MSVKGILVVGILCLLFVVSFLRQIADQLRSGRFRPRAWREVTREGNPVSFWSYLGIQVVAVLIALYILSETILRATK
jgi:hypothetical protein